MIIKLNGFLKAFCTVILIIINLSACDPIGENQTNTKVEPAVGKTQKQLWHRIRNNYTMSPKDIKSHKQPHIQKYVKSYTQQDKTLKKIGTQATPYLYHIVEQLEKRDMPGELALLPMLESAFQPQATSNRGAAGLWQFIPSTGRMYGLKQDAWYDGRRDVRASTTAALDYLAFLHEKFDHNWMLALAAYNAGEGTVQRAIKRNLKQGKPTSFWDLNLPKETREYVPKFLALAEIIGHPEKHAVSLPDIEDKPYFVPVSPSKSLNFQQVAKFADMQVNELKRLNPGHKQAVMHPKSPQELLLPVANKEKFEYNLKNKASK